MWGHSEKEAIYTLRTKISPLSWTSSLLNCEKISFCCLSHPDYGILLGSPSCLIYRPHLLSCDTGIDDNTWSRSRLITCSKRSHVKSWTWCLVYGKSSMISLVIVTDSEVWFPPQRPGHGSPTPHMVGLGLKRGLHFWKLPWQQKVCAYTLTWGQGHQKDLLEWFFKSHVSS